MKMKYVDPELKIIRLQTEDILATSNNTPATEENETPIAPWHP